MDSKQEVIGALRSVLNLSERSIKFDGSTPLLGAIPELDSMAVVALLTSLEERFGFVIEDDEVDTDLLEKLKDEAPGILAWAMRGCLQYQEDGLKQPKEVEAAVHEFRNDSDIFGRFVAEYCVPHSGAEVSFENLYAEFSSFCKKDLRWKEPATENKLSREMKRKGFTRVKKGGRAYLVGLGLRSEI